MDLKNLGSQLSQYLENFGFNMAETPTGSGVDEGDVSITIVFSDKTFKLHDSLENLSTKEC